MGGVFCNESVVWSKGLRSGRNVFERVGSNPTADNMNDTFKSLLGDLGCTVFPILLPTTRTNPYLSQIIVLLGSVVYKALIG